MTPAARIALAALSLCSLLALWSFLATRYDPVTLPSPSATGGALLALLGDRGFLAGTLLPSILRILAGVSLAFAGGTALGLLAGLVPVLRPILFPVRLTLMSMPAAVLVVLLLIWTGPTSATTVIAASVMLAPVFYVAALDGLAGVDPRLMEMAAVHRVPWDRRIRAIIAPAVTVAMLPAIRTGAANGIRVTILAEILAGAGGLGDRIASARQYLQTDQLFALIIVVVGLVVVLEAGLGYLVSRMRGRLP
ncbi:MAG: ABC transporter permease subunit [Pseudomonadota bacterium]